MSGESEFMKDGVVQMDHDCRSAFDRAFAGSCLFRDQFGRYTHGNTTLLALGFAAAWSRRPADGAEEALEGCLGGLLTLLELYGVPHEDEEPCEEHCGHPACASGCIPLKIQDAKRALSTHGDGT